MAVKQISVFVENKEGRIKKAIDTLAKANINIRALSIADTAKYGILKNEVLLLTVPDEPNGLNSTLAVFDEKGINLEYLYAFVSNKTDEALVVMRLEDMEKAVEALEANNIKILETEDIKDL